MSRIGNRPVPITSGVSVAVSAGIVTVQGPLGKLSRTLPRQVSLELTEGTVSVKRHDDSRSSKAIHGLTRALLNNMVIGVLTGFQKRLEIQGVGYQAAVKGKILSLNVGFAHSVDLAIPEGIACITPDATHVTVSGVSKEAVGQFAANIRAVRKPEPYKGKGIRYSGEYVKRKSGKAFGTK